jgi:hypothetical protein
MRVRATRPLSSSACVASLSQRSPYRILHVLFLVVGIKKSRKWRNLYPKYCLGVMNADAWLVARPNEFSQSSCTDHVSVTALDASPDDEGHTHLT